MYCRQCGSLNDDNAFKCVKCGDILQQTAVDGTAPVVISNYLAPAILSTLCCCGPFGIPAIVFAAQVNGKIQAGDIQGALTAAKWAKIWCWVSFGTGLVWFAVCVILQLLMAVIIG
jgi:hypothetical protein